MVKSHVLPWRGFWVAKFTGDLEAEAFHTPAGPRLWRGVTCMRLAGPVDRRDRAELLATLEWAHDHPLA